MAPCYQEDGSHPAEDYPNDHRQNNTGLRLYLKFALRYEANSDQTAS